MKLRWLALAFLAATRVGNVTRIACTHRDGITFTLRMRAACRVARAGNCATGDCRARCD